MAKIVLMVSREEMFHQAHNILQEKKYPIDEIKIVSTEHVVEEARTAIAGGAEMIIARGLQASLIKKYTNVPVIEIVMTAQEMALLIIKAKQIVQKESPVIGIVGFKNMFCDMSYFDTIYNIELRTYFSADGDELREVACLAVKDNVDLIIGGDTAVNAAANAGIPSLFLSITEDSLRSSFKAAEQLNYAMNIEKRNAAQMETLLDYSFNGIVKMDSCGTITASNLMIEEILNCNKQELVGKKITDVFEDMDREQMDRIFTKGEDTYSFFTKAGQTTLYAILAPVQIEGMVCGAILSCHKIKRIQQRREYSASDQDNRNVVWGDFSDICQISKQMKKCIKEAMLYAQSDQPVLILGEVGTEKRLIAQGIFHNSPRNNLPYLQINCGSISTDKQRETLFEDKGVLANLDGGTVFLENVQKLSYGCQCELAELIQYKVRRNGRMQAVPIDVRIIASAPENLEKGMESGQIYEDLSYILQGLTVSVPPLRERREDLKDLLGKYMKEFCNNYSHYHVLTSGAEKILLDYSWEGNLIQLQNFCERLILTANRRTIDEIAVTRLIDEMYTASSFYKSEKKQYISPEAVRLKQTLEKHAGNRERTAEALGISKATLWRHMKKYGIQFPFKDE